MKYETTGLNQTQVRILTMVSGKILFCPQKGVKRSV